MYEEIDFSKGVDFLQQELFKEIIDRKKGTVYTDQLVKVHLKSGEEKWILIHVEVEGSPDSEFPARMFQYFYRIFDKYEREIVAFAVFTDTTKGDQYNAFNYKYFGTTLNYAYNVRKISDYSEEELAQSKDLFSKVMLAAKYLLKTKGKEEARYEAKQKLMKDLLETKAYSKESIRAVFYFIDHLLQLPKELTGKLSKQVKSILQKGDYEMLQYNREEPSPTLADIIAIERGKGIQQGIEQGIEQGEKQGLEKAKAQMAMKLLSRDYDLLMIAELTDLTLVEVEAIREKWLDRHL